MRILPFINIKESLPFIKWQTLQKLEEENKRTCLDWEHFQYVFWLRIYKDRGTCAPVQCKKDKHIQDLVWYASKAGIVVSCLC